MPKLKTHKGAAKTVQEDGNRQNQAPACICPSYPDLEVALTEAPAGTVGHRGSGELAGDQAHDSVLGKLPRRCIRGASREWTVRRTCLIRRDSKFQ